MFCWFFRRHAAVQKPLTTAVAQPRTRGGVALRGLEVEVGDGRMGLVDGAGTWGDSSFVP